MASIRFCGAAGTVTGSRHLVEANGRRILLDCGLFQGLKELRLKNWEPFPVPAGSVDAVVLSHAHIDHTGYLPRLINEGFTGPVYVTPATKDLLAIMLPDSGRIQQEEAAFANKMGFSKHHPALPLYDEEGAKRSLKQLQSLPYGTPKELFPGISLLFRRAGHILGSATVTLEVEEPGREKHTIVFSGDLGRYDTPIIPDPESVTGATTLLVECTYGDRSHQETDPRQALGEEILRIMVAGGVLLIPAFAIGRTQDLLYHIRRLQVEGRIPEPIPIFVDSPMACDATPLYMIHREEHDDEMVRALMAGERPIQPKQLEFSRSVQESRDLNERLGPMIILSASGMATAGRILHHLKRRLPDPKTTVLFVGYQAEGTRGRRLLDGATSVKIHGGEVPVRARVARVDGFSAHADKDEVDRWLASIRTPPRTTFLVHGEASSLEATRARLAGRGWNAKVPAYLETCEL